MVANTVVSDRSEGMYHLLFLWSYSGAMDLRPPADERFAAWRLQGIGYPFLLIPTVGTIL
jgi:hypothetical protein